MHSKIKQSFLLSLLGAWLYCCSGMAAELKVLSAGAIEPGMEIAIHQFEKNTGHKVSIQFGTGPQIKERLAAKQSFDVLAAPNALIDEQIDQGHLKPNEKVYVGKVGAGVTVRKNLPNPKIATVDELKNTLLSADKVVYNKASTGIYLEKLFAKMGIGEALKDKTVRYGNGEAVLMHIINGSGNEIGFGAITEIKLFESKGLRYVGPLPSDVQNYTSYSAGIMNSASNPQIAKSFIDSINVVRSSVEFKNTGIE